MFPHDRADVASAMTQDLQNAYLRAKVFSATPEELRLMLLDGALRFTRQAREGLAAKNYEASFHGFTSARAILLELAQSISPDTDEALRSNISGVYMFIYRRLVDANLEKSAAVVDEAISLLEYERETWALYLEKHAAPRAHAAEPAAPTASPAADADPAQRPALCVQA